MKDPIRQLIAHVGALVPTYWPDPPATDAYVLDFERGVATVPALPEGETVLSLIASGDERSLLGGPEILDESYDYYAEDILGSLAEALGSVLPLYAPHRPTDGLKDPHAVAHKVRRGDGSYATLEVRGLNGTLQVVDTTAAEHTMLFVHPSPGAPSGLAVTVTSNIDAATAEDRQRALDRLVDDVIHGRDPGDETD